MLLLGWKLKRRGCLPGELRSSEVRASKITTSKAAMAKVRANKARSGETNALKRTSSKIAAWKIGWTKIHINEIIPIRSGLGKVGASKGSGTNLGAAKERARQRQMLKLCISKHHAEKTDAKHVVIVTRRTLGTRRNGTRVNKLLALKLAARVIVGKSLWHKFSLRSGLFVRPRRLAVAPSKRAESHYKTAHDKPACPQCVLALHQGHPYTPQVRV
jgi:hypothetical protein